MLLDDRLLCGFGHEPIRQGSRVEDARAQQLGALVVRADDADYAEFGAVSDELRKMFLVLALVDPDVEVLVPDVVVRRVHELELGGHDLVVAEVLSLGRGVDLLGGHHLADHLVELCRILEPHAVERKITDAAAAGQHDEGLVVVLWPASGDDVVAFLDDVEILGELGERTRPHASGHGARARRRCEAEGRERGIGIHLAGPVGQVGRIEMRRDVIGVVDAADEIVHPPSPVVEERLEGFQVVRPDAREHVCHERHFTDLPFRARPVTVRFVREIRRRREHCGHVEALGLDRQGVLREGVLLDALDVVVDAVREGEDRCDPDDPDAAGEGRHQRPALLGHQVVERQRDRSEEAHARVPHTFGLLDHRRIRAVRVRILDDLAIAQLHDAGGVLVCQFRIVGHHDDEPVLGDLRQQSHDLHAGCGVEGARRLVGQKDLRVVDECAGDGDALHLPTRQLIRPLVDVIGQPDVRQGCGSPSTALRAGDTCQSQSELDVGEDGLMRDEVVALEDEPHAVVAVGVPITIAVALGRDPVDDEVTGVILVQSTDDVEHCRLARTGRPEDRDELAGTEGDGSAIQGDLGEVTSGVRLAHFPQLEHANLP